MFLLFGPDFNLPPCLHFTSDLYHRPLIFTTRLCAIEWEVDHNRNTAMRIATGQCITIISHYNYAIRNYNLYSEVQSYWKQSSEKFIKFLLLSRVEGSRVCTIYTEMLITINWKGLILFRILFKNINYWFKINKENNPSAFCYTCIDLSINQHNIRTWVMMLLLFWGLFWVECFFLTFLASLSISGLMRSKIGLLLIIL